jgi:hypothetical protein
MSPDTWKAAMTPAALPVRAHEVTGGTRMVGTMRFHHQP